ncbi:MAG: hypothetical protein ACXVIF_07490 [Halobacteriota archaeon]
MYKELILLLSLLICSMGIAGCLSANNSSQQSGNAPGFPQTYNVTGKNFTLMAPKVGQWVRYKVVAPNGSESFLTYRITEKIGEEFIIDVATAGKNASSPSRPNNTVEARFHSEDGSLVNVSSERNADVLSNLFFNSSQVNTHKVALQDINVSYGTLTCIHSRIGTSDVWMNEEVPVTGVVKAVTGNQYLLLDALNKSGDETATA